MNTPMVTGVEIPTAGDVAGVIGSPTFDGGLKWQEQHSQQD